MSAGHADRHSRDMLRKCFIMCIAVSSLGGRVCLMRATFYIVHTIKAVCERMRAVKYIVYVYVWTGGLL